MIGGNNNFATKKIIHYSKHFPVSNSGIILGIMAILMGDLCHELFIFHFRIMCLSVINYPPSYFCLGSFIYPYSRFWCISDLISIRMVLPFQKK